MKNAAIIVLWGINAWYVANFASLATDTPSVGPVAAVAAAAIAYLVLTRRARTRAAMLARATA